MKQKRTHIILYVLLILLPITMLIPFLWMVSTSLKTDLEVYSFPPVLVPKEVRWSNYLEALTLQPFGRFFLNSAIVSVFSVLGQLIFCS
ncbi:MAG: carbohydrate ABC transporter permease, partial [Bacteroidota bacterium]